MQLSLSISEKDKVRKQTINIEPVMTCRQFRQQIASLLSKLPEDITISQDGFFIYDSDRLVSIDCDKIVEVSYHRLIKDEQEVDHFRRDLNHQFHKKTIQRNNTRNLQLKAQRRFAIVDDWETIIRERRNSVDDNNDSIIEETLKSIFDKDIVDEIENTEEEEMEDLNDPMWDRIIRKMDHSPFISNIEEC